MPAFELVNLKTNQIILLPATSIKNLNLRQAAFKLNLWNTLTIGFIQVTRIY
jgi:hypothetical protein